MSSAPATGTEVPSPAVQPTLSAVDIGILIGFNLAVAVLLRIVLKQVDLRGALREKSPSAAVPVPDAPALPGSSSRVTALIGAVILACFLWATANVVLRYWLVGDIARAKEVIGSMGSYFLAGMALFGPYAVNQLQTAFKGGGSSS